MSEYIVRAGIIAEFHRLGLGENSLAEKIFADGVYAVLKTFPTADVEPVRHGRWIPDDYEYNHCSECGFEHDEPEYVTPYCPNCGCKMDGEAASDDAD